MNSRFSGELKLWREYIFLSAGQDAALCEALERAAEDDRIRQAIEQESARLNAGDYCIRTPEEELIDLYGTVLYRMHPVLVLFRKLPELTAEYKLRGIPEKILRDTLSDVRIWMDVCEKQTGFPGLLEYGWLGYHFSFRLFRLGRLQFVYGKNDVPAVVYRHRKSGVVTALCPDGGRYTLCGDGAGTNGEGGDWQAALTIEEGAVKGSPIHPSGMALNRKVTLDLNEWEKVLCPDDPVLETHIAEGCPLDEEAAALSFEQAPEFFRKYLGIDDIRAFTCGSWLLDDNIAQLQPHGNIARFMRRFYLVPHEDSSDWQTKQRAFGDPDVDILTADCQTSLQKAIRAWYASGRKCRHAKGFILI